MNQGFRIAGILVLLVVLHVNAAGLHPARGVSMIWYGGQANLGDRNGVVANGQIFFMWRDFEPTEGNYTLSELDAQLKAVHDKGMKATIQINGNKHPDYLFNIVPYLNGKDYSGQLDHTIGYGPLMYWHATYRQKFENMIRALAEHLKQSPYKSAVLGIRHSPNAVGTEHYYIKPEDQTQTNWTLPAGAAWRGPWPWTSQIAAEYRAWTLDMFIGHFNPPTGIPLFMRASAISGDYATDTHKRMAEEGEVMLFETSSEPQPRDGKESQYQVFVNYCKSGKTWGLTESWSEAVTGGAWGWTKTSQPITLDQFNYWTLLVDLHCGSSFPARRPEDIDRTGFRSDYEFAARYAGYHHEPAKSPGAWIAFREGDYLAGDYTFLMTHESPANTTPLYNIDDTRYGLWSRKLAGGENTTVALDSTFAQSLGENTAVVLRIYYKDTGAGSFAVTAFNQKFSQQKQNSGSWKTAEFTASVSSNTLRIQIEAVAVDLVLHMVEVCKTGQTGIHNDRTNNNNANLSPVTITSQGTSVTRGLGRNASIDIVTLSGRVVYSIAISAAYTGAVALPPLAESAAGLWIVRVRGAGDVNIQTSLARYQP